MSERGEFDRPRAIDERASQIRWELIIFFSLFFFLFFSIVPCHRGWNRRYDKVARADRARRCGANPFGKTCGFHVRVHRIRQRIRY